MWLLHIELIPSRGCQAINSPTIIGDRIRRADLLAQHTMPSTTAIQLSWWVVKYRHNAKMEDLAEEPQMDCQLTMVPATTAWLLQDKTRARPWSLPQDRSKLLQVWYVLL